MNWNALGAVGEIVGAVAVVVSLVYLAIQIRFSARTARSEAVRTAIKEHQGYALLHLQPEIASLFRRGLHSFKDLDADEKVQFNAYWVTQISSHMAIRDLHDSGDLPDSEFEIYQHDIVCCLLCPGLREWWSQVSHSWFGWAEYIETLINDWQGKTKPYTETFPHLSQP